VKVLVFGNPLVSKDSLALKMLPALAKKFPQIEFREFDSAENLEDEGRDIILLDSAEGVGKVTLLEDLDNLGTGKIYSMHDFDLALTLKILKKMGMIDRVRIIAVPSSLSLSRATDGASRILSILLSESG
jgi:Ni,Fe-hydrogenase maturation factor